MKLIDAMGYPIGDPARTTTLRGSERCSIAQLPLPGRAAP
jgi:hypothetical protein